MVFYAASTSFYVEDKDFAWIELVYKTIFGWGLCIWQSHGSRLRPCIILCFLFFLPIFLVAACTTRTGFEYSNERRSTCWSQLFSKLPRVTRLRVPVRHLNDKNVTQTPCFLQMKTEGQMDQEKILSCHCAHQTTLVDHGVY
mgnify:CR=1 FL=1